MNVEGSILHPMHYTLCVSVSFPYSIGTEFVMNVEKYSTKEAADIIGVHKNTILNWIKNGKIKDVRRDWKLYRIWTVKDLEKLKEYKEKYQQLKLNIKE